MTPLKKTLEKIFIYVAVFVVGFIFAMYSIEATRIEAQTLQTQRLQFQAFESWDWNGSRPSRGNAYFRVAVICDTATGNLIYSGGLEGGTWGVPNGCHKVPR